MSFKSSESVKSIGIVSLLVVAGLANAQYTINSGSIPPPSGTEPWRGILDYTRAVDWRNAGVKIGGVLGIPAYTYNCGTVVPTGLKNWQPNHAYASGQQIADSRGNVETVVAPGGTSGPTEPTNGAVLGQTNAWPIVPNQPFSEAAPATVTWNMTQAGTDTAQVTNAIINCAAYVKANSLPGGIVQLSAGNFYFTAGLAFNSGAQYPQSQTNPFPTMNGPISGVVLRGQGPMQTTLHFTDEGPCSSDICVISYPASFTNYAAGGSIPSSINPGAAAQWMGSGQFVGTYAKGDTQLIASQWIPTPTLTAPEPAVGDVLFLDQNNDAFSICPDPSKVTNPPPGNCPLANIAGATASGSTATIVTSVAHGFTVGQCVGIGDVGGTGSSINTGIGFNTGANPDKTHNCGLRPGIDNGIDEPPHLPAWWQITAVGCIQTGAFVDVSLCGNSVINAFQFNLGQTAAQCPPTNVNCLNPTGGGQVTADTLGVILSSVNGVTSTCCNNPAQNARLCPGGNTSPNPSCLISQGEISIRSQFEVKAITAINSAGSGTCPPGAGVYKCYTIDPPLYMNNWRASQRPGIWWTGKKNTGIGLEGFTYLTEHDFGNGHVGGIQFINSYNCWVRNVRALQINRNFVWSDRSGRIEAVDNYIGGTRGGAETAYVFEAYSTADDLMMNNICEHTVSCYMTSTVMGRVTAYNYMTDPAYTVTYDWLMPLMTMNHLAAFMNLFEGNDSAGVHTDNLHGTAGVSTMFRQRSRGQDLPTKMINRNGLSSWSFIRGLNFIGNVMGWLGVQTHYLDNTQAAASGQLDQAIFGFGKWKQGIGAFGNDHLATSTSLRWGNYDAVTQTVRWCGTGNEASCSCGAATGSSYCPAPGNSLAQFAAEIPTQGSLFLSPNAIPANQTLPPSFFLSSQPYFWVTNWGTPGWPAIGPDVNASGSPLDTTCPGGITVNPGTGAGSFSACDGIGDHAYQIPSQICYNHLPIDTTWNDAKIGGTGQETFAVTGAAFTPNSNPAYSYVTLTANNDLNLNYGVGVVQMTYTIQVSGITPAGFNGTFQVHIAPSGGIPGSSSTTLVYNLPNPPSGCTTGCTLSVSGQATTPNFKQYDAHMCYPNLPY